jgi:hypothetical protein
LQTDYLDVLALHDPDPNDLAYDEVLRALQDVLKNGQARAIGIAGSIEAAERALTLGFPIAHIQFAHDPFGPGAAHKTISDAATGIYRVTHSAFASRDAIKASDRLLRLNPELQRMLRVSGYDLPIQECVRAALVDHALRANPSGTVLFSMFSKDHLDFNVSRSTLTSDVDPQPFLDAIRTQLNG